VDRSEFIRLTGSGVALTLLGCLSGCSDNSAFPTAPTNVDFSLDVSSGSLASNGGYLVKNGVLIARTLSGAFIAVSAACTHQGTTLEYQAASHRFFCFSHGSTFNENGVVTNGPATQSLTVYKTSLTGSSLHIFS